MYDSKSGKFIGENPIESDKYINHDLSVCAKRKTNRVSLYSCFKYDYNAAAYVWIFVRKGTTTTQPSKTIQAYSDIAKEWGTFLGGTELMGTITFNKANGVSDTFFAYRTKNTAGAGDSATFRLN